MCEDEDDVDDKINIKRNKPEPAIDIEAVVDEEDKQLAGANQMEFDDDDMISPKLRQKSDVKQGLLQNHCGNNDMR